MNWYDKYRREWKEIIKTVAAEECRTTQTVEKDTIQSMFLLELSKCELPFVFKGGTSLSKAYGLINRFSEDIDLSMSRKLTESERRRSNDAIMDISGTMGLTLSNSEEIHSRYSYNKYVFEYKSLFSDIPLQMMVETSFYQAVYPVEMHEIHGIVGNFCQKNAISLPIPFNASFVSMRVQSLERTFIDKIFAICDYRIQNRRNRKSRHLYDIAKILPKIQITDDLDELIDTVRRDRMRSKNNPSAQLEFRIPDVLKEIMSSRFYESDYNMITRKLLYEDISYDEAIKNGIASIANTDIFDYKAGR